MCLGIPGEVISIDESEPSLRMAKVKFGGVIKEVSLALTPEAKVGDYVIVHAGVAISVIDEDEAMRIMAEFATMENAMDETENE